MYIFTILDNEGFIKIHLAMSYSNMEAYDMLLILGECRDSFSAAEILWRQRYPDQTPHSRNVFSRLAKRIQNEGVIQPHHNKGRQIHHPIRDERAAEILESAELNPRDSLRRRERNSGVSRNSIWRGFRQNKFHPYRMSLYQALNNNDFHQRLAFCNWIRQPPDFHHKILFSDECTFKSDGSVNTWNCRHWSLVNPHRLREIDHQHVWKINVWCGIIGNRIIGPIFFEENLNADRYSALIETDLPVLLETLPLRLRLDMWFQQNGCPSHTSRVARTILNTMFPNKWIGKYGPINYPPRSPDLTILDYFLWGRVKDMVYRERPTIKDNMIHRISEAILSLGDDEILRATNSFQNRIDACIAANGAHFEYFV
ncbi:uncharacterized protein LOC115243229 [Formica exsecta]|uniref:uncharacterized protein LOC115243229 n=1 Tax=Formica exsecta TaxID=72781 RepID=UPI0011418EE2|nr:uncharacterized protein LOC115243229 [Formica exsecta]